MDDHASTMARLSDDVFFAHPGLEDHRSDHPWLTGWLGDVTSPVWFVAENPSARQVDRIHSATATPEAQWAASRGDRLLREAMVEAGLKEGLPLGPGGWRCYITNVMKSEVRVKEWNGTKKSEQLAVAEAWAPVLRYELEAGQPRKLLVLGGKAFDALTHLQRHRLIDSLPPIERLDHYSYVMMRPDRQRQLPPGDPVRQLAWKQSVLRASRL